MKKIIALSIVGFIICTAFKKPINLITDYRDAYTGIYTCKRYAERLNLQTKLYDLDTGKTNITVTKADVDSVLQISVRGQNLQAKLISGGVLQPYPLESKNYGGKFASTSNLDFYYNPDRTLFSRYIGSK
ncbi:MAG TPA: hypothetical protein VKG26_01685 [Bacteroidia bacterium]|nr:hypothetical protein [Bacteroidia bacterium]